MKTLTTGISGVVACVFLSACSAYRITRTDEIALNSTVRVQFHEATHLVFQASDGDSLRVENVIELEGRLVARAEDSVTMVVSNAEQLHPIGASNPRRFEPWTRIQFEVRDGVGLSTRQLDGGMTAVAIGIPVVGLGLILYALAQAAGDTVGDIFEATIKCALNPECSPEAR